MEKNCKGWKVHSEMNKEYHTVGLAAWRTGRVSFALRAAITKDAIEL